MKNVLLPVDGSDSAFRAAMYVADFVKKHGPVTVHLVNVQPKPQEWQTHGMEPEAIKSHLSVLAHGALKPVQHLLNEAGIAYHAHLELGDVAETLVALADGLGCDHIVMGTRGLGGISGIVLGSVTRKVLHLAKVPVTCIKADSPGR